MATAATASGSSKVRDTSSSSSGNGNPLGSGLATWEWALLLLVVGGVILLGLTTDEWIGLVGVGATVLGLAVAIRQIISAQRQIEQTLSVAQATQRAMTRTRADLARSEMIALIPKLQQIDRGLGVAARGKDSDPIGLHLSEWRDGTYEFIGLLEGGAYATESLLDDLHSTAKSAANMVTELPDAAPEARVETKQIRADISGVCGRLGILHSKLKLSNEERNDASP